MAERNHMNMFSLVYSFRLIFPNNFSLSLIIVLFQQNHPSVVVSNRSGTFWTVQKGRCLRSFMKYKALIVAKLRQRGSCCGSGGGKEDL